MLDDETADPGTMTLGYCTDIHQRCHAGASGLWEVLIRRRGQDRDDRTERHELD